MEERIIYLLDKLMKLEKELNEAEEMLDIHRSVAIRKDEEIVELNAMITSLELRIEDLENKETKVFVDEEA